MTDHSFTITRTYKTSPEQLFQAWTNPEQYKRWIAPPPWSVGQFDMDVREGGKFTVETITPDGQAMTFAGHYVTLEPNNRLVQRTDLMGPDGTKYMEDNGLEVSFREVSPGVTEQTLVHSGLPNAEAATDIEAGWTNGGLMDLERYLAGDL